MGTRRQDHFTRRAQKEGMAARSVYKLEELDKRYKVLRKGSRVLDLGCSPGSWMQYASRVIGSHGTVIGFDLKPVEVDFAANAVSYVGDAFELNIADFPDQFNVVLSDMAPATMGDHKIDAIRSAALAECALAVAERLLLPGGNVVVKVLEGGDIPQIVKGMRLLYNKVERLRPKATRKQSTEIFLIGLGRLKIAQ